MNLDLREQIRITQLLVKVGDKIDRGTVQFFMYRKLNDADDETEYIYSANVPFATSITELMFNAGQAVTPGAKFLEFEECKHLILYKGMCCNCAEDIAIHLFPNGTSMVCMIDDRNDVWKGFENNVIKVRKYS